MVPGRAAPAQGWQQCLLSHGLLKLSVLLGEALGDPAVVPECAPASCRQLRGEPQQRAVIASCHGARQSCAYPGLAAVSAVSRAAEVERLAGGGAGGPCGAPRARGRQLQAARDAPARVRGEHQQRAVQGPGHDALLCGHAQRGDGAAAAVVADHQLHAQAQPLRDRPDLSAHRCTPSSPPILTTDVEALAIVQSHTTIDDGKSTAASRADNKAESGDCNSRLTDLQGVQPEQGDDASQAARQQEVAGGGDREG